MSPCKLVQQNKDKTCDIQLLDGSQHHVAAEQLDHRFVSDDDTLRLMCEPQNFLLYKNQMSQFLRNLKKVTRISQKCIVIVNKVDQSTLNFIKNKVVFFPTYESFSQATTIISEKIVQQLNLISNELNLDQIFVRVECKSQRVKVGIFPCEQLQSEKNRVVQREKVQTTSGQKQISSGQQQNTLDLLGLNQNQKPPVEYDNAIALCDSIAQQINKMQIQTILQQTYYLIPSSGSLSHYFQSAQITLIHNQSLYLSSYPLFLQRTMSQFQSPHVYLLSKYNTNSVKICEYVRDLMEKDYFVVRIIDAFLLEYDENHMIQLLNLGIKNKIIRIDVEYAYFPRVWSLITINQIPLDKRDLFNEAFNKIQQKYKEISVVDKIEEIQQNNNDQDIVGGHTEIHIIPQTESFVFSGQYQYGGSEKHINKQNYEQKQIYFEKRSQKQNKKSLTKSDLKQETQSDNELIESKKKKNKREFIDLDLKYQSTIKPEFNEMQYRLQQIKQIEEQQNSIENAQKQTTQKQKIIQENEQKKSIRDMINSYSPLQVPKNADYQHYSKATYQNQPASNLNQNPQSVPYRVEDIEQAHNCLSDAQQQNNKQKNKGNDDELIESLVMQDKKATTLKESLQLSTSGQYDDETQHKINSAIQQINQSDCSESQLDKFNRSRQQQIKQQFIQKEQQQIVEKQKMQNDLQQKQELEQNQAQANNFNLIDQKALFAYKNSLQKQVDIRVSELTQMANKSNEKQQNIENNFEIQKQKVKNYANPQRTTENQQEHQQKQQIVMDNNRQQRQVNQIQQKNSTFNDRLSQIRDEYFINKMVLQSKFRNEQDIQDMENQIENLEVKMQKSKILFEKQEIKQKIDQIKANEQKLFENRKDAKESINDVEQNEETIEEEIQIIDQKQDQLDQNINKNIQIQKPIQNISYPVKPGHLQNIYQNQVKQFVSKTMNRNGDKLHSYEHFLK